MKIDPQVYVTSERIRNNLAGIRHVTFIVRTPRPLSGLMPDITTAVSLADQSQAASNIRTMWDTAFASVQRRRVYAGLVGTFAATAALLAALGVYGVMAQVVGCRTNEIGIRMALGANRARVRLLVIRQGLLLIGVGLFIGIVGALAFTRLIRNSLFGVLPTDLLTYLASAVLLGAAALIACYLPARRASRIDPMLALRHD
jgi:ABC-type antimicrobial peptide transport system permease subunit